MDPSNCILTHITLLVQKREQLFWGKVILISVGSCGGGGLGLKDPVKGPKATPLKGTDMDNLDKSITYGLF